MHEGQKDNVRLEVALPGIKEVDSLLTECLPRGKAFRTRSNWTQYVNQSQVGTVSLSKKKATPGMTR